LEGHEALLLRRRLPVAVGRLVPRDRRVRVEAVDRRVLRRGELLDPRGAVRLDDGGVQVTVAHVLGVGTAHPPRRVVVVLAAVVRVARQRRGSLAAVRGGGRGAGPAAPVTVAARGEDGGAGRRGDGESSEVPPAVHGSGTYRRRRPRSGWTRCAWAQSKRGSPRIERFSSAI